MKIDWNEAPEGAEIYLPNQQGTAECFVSFRDYEVYYAYSGMRQWARWAGESKDTLLSRFRHSWKAWTGEGLPPVGTVCEYRVSNGGWFKCEIRYVTTPYHDCPVEVVMFPPHLKGEQTGVVGHGPGEVNFRQIRTPEQIAAEEREKGIQEMREAAGSLNNFPFDQLYDAGYRKQVKP